MAPIDLHPTASSPKRDIKSLQWEVFKETAGVWGVADFTKNGFVDHINTTKDATDYLWYTTRLVSLSVDSITIILPEHVHMNSIKYLVYMDEPHQYEWIDATFLFLWFPKHIITSNFSIIHF